MPGIVRLPGRGKEKPQVIVNLRGGGDGRARVAAGGALLDGDGRREPLDEVHIRLLHLVEKLPRIDGKALHVAALALRVEGVESQARFAGAAQAGNDHQLLARNLQGEVLEIVLAGARDFYNLGRHLAILNRPENHKASPVSSDFNLPCPILQVTKEDLQELHEQFREIKHNINNTLAVVMALSELGQRNPAHFEKLAKAVLQRGPEVVQQLQNFQNSLTAKIKGTEPTAPSETF